MTKQISIQDKIKVDSKWIEKIIKQYENMKPNFYLSFGDFKGNKDDIIREIRNLTSVGKQMLLMNYNFEHSKFYKKNKSKIKEVLKNAKKHR